MKPTKRISHALTSMTLALATGCATPSPSSPTTTIAKSAPAAQPASQTAQPAASMLPSLPFGRGTPPPSQSALARQVTVAWNNQVLTTSDTQNGNRPLSGLAGRLYVFGEDVGRPLEAPGSVKIVVYAVDKDNKIGPPLANWIFDSAALQKLGRKDAIGFGYTLFLPWPEYTPEIRRVKLDVQYVPDGGQPLFAPSSTFALHQDGPPAVFTNRMEPASAKR
jgi:hypothetical protein